MDRDTTLSVIEDKLEVIREQFEIIRSHEGKVPAIELDLLLANVREIYEFLGYFTRQNEALAYGTEAPVAPNLPSSPKRSVRVKEKPVPRIEEIVPAQAPGEPEPVVFDLFADSPKSEGTRSRPAPLVREPAYVMPQEDPVVMAPVEPPPPKPVETTPPPPPVRTHPDIKTFIGINEKFRFINELFDGNLRIYDESIQKLNQTESSTDADQILNDLKDVFSWKTGEETAQLFRRLVLKRFE